MAACTTSMMFTQRLRPSWGEERAENALEGHSHWRREPPPPHSKHSPLLTWSWNDSSIMSVILKAGPWSARRCGSKDLYRGFMSTANI